MLKQLVLVLSMLALVCAHAGAINSNNFSATAIADPLGNEQTYAYDANGNLASQYSSTPLATMVLYHRRRQASTDILPVGGAVKKAPARAIRVV